jgi:hypothetical protein
MTEETANGYPWNLIAEAVTAGCDSQPRVVPEHSVTLRIILMCADEELKMQEDDRPRSVLILTTGKPDAMFKILMERRTQNKLIPSKRKINVDIHQVRNPDNDEFGFYPLHDPAFENRTHIVFDQFSSWNRSNRLSNYDEIIPHPL